MLMRMVRGSPLAASGSIRVSGVDVAAATRRPIIALRRDTPGYFGQFPRIVPRVLTPAVVAKPPLMPGSRPEAVHTHRAALLRQLNIPEWLRGLSPTTFQSGEQSRVNIARGFVHPDPGRLLEEATADPNTTSRKIMLRRIKKATAQGATILGIFHDEAARTRDCDPRVDMPAFTPQAAA